MSLVPGDGAVVFDGNGDLPGAAVSCPVGALLGDAVSRPAGALLGDAVSRPSGFLLGDAVSCPDGALLGDAVSCPAGVLLGDAVSFPIGRSLGNGDDTDGSPDDAGRSLTAGVAEPFGLPVGTTDACGFAEVVVTGFFVVKEVASGELLLPAFFTFTVITHFFMPLAVNVTFALPAFFPVILICFFTTFTVTAFLLDTFALIFRDPVFFTLTLTVFPTVTVTFVLLVLIFAAADAVSA